MQQGKCFVIFEPADEVKKWWIWGYWISPMMYAHSAISVNEFLGHSWDKILNNSVSNETLGVQVLKSRGVLPEAKWYWIGFGALLGFTLLFNALFTLALTYLKREYLLDWFVHCSCISQHLYLKTVSSSDSAAYGKSHPSVSEEVLKEKHANLNDDVLDDSLLASGTTYQAAVNNTETNSAIVEHDSGSKQRGMVLPFVPLSLTFDNIRYSVSMPQVENGTCFSYVVNIGSSS